MTFFTKIQGKFAHTYQGRYLAHILSAIADVRPSILEPFVNERTSKPLRVADYVYKGGNDESRFADLAVFSEDSIQPLALIEIKADDYAHSPHNREQLKAYINWARKGAKESGRPRQIVVLTQYPLPKKTLQLIDQNKDIVRAITFGDYAHKIHKPEDKSELVGLLFDFLRDKGLIMARMDESDIDALKSFLVLTLLPRIAGHRNQGSTKKIAKGPEVFSRLVQNWQLVSSGFVNKFLDGQAPTVRYFPSQSYRKTARISEDEDVDRNYKSGGNWKIFGQSVIMKVAGQSGSLHLIFGMQLIVEKGSGNGKRPQVPEITIYAEITHQERQLGFSEKKLPGISPSKLAESLSDIAKLHSMLLELVAHTCDLVGNHGSLSNYSSDQKRNLLANVKAMRKKVSKAASSGA